MSFKPSCTPVPRLEQDSYDWNVRFQYCCEQAKKRRADIVFIGDSITHFWDSQATPSHGGPVWDRYFSGRNVLNIGFGWDRTPNVLWRLDHGNFENQKPKLVILNIGTNNFSKTEHYAGDTPEDVADGIEAVIQKLHDLSPDSMIVDMAVFPRGNRGEEFADKVFALTAIMKERLKDRKNVLLLDLTEKFMNTNGKQKTELFIDGCHLSHAGYEIWGEALVPLIAKYC